MDKSVYSVMLSDELVGLLDREAYKNGVSRSAMLDRILGERYSVETLEMQMDNIFSIMGRLIGVNDGMKFINGASGYMAAVQSALAYKYNPTVKYSVELFPSGDLGQLKISLRSQSETLLSIMETFYEFFIGLEKKHIGERIYGYDGNRFTRVFLRPDGATSEEVGKAVASYVSDFDGYLRIYFSSLGDSDKAFAAIENRYIKDLRQKEVIL